MGIICDTCGRDIDALGQDNMSCTCEPLCEDCWNEQQSHAVAVLRREVETAYELRVTASPTLKGAAQDAAMPCLKAEEARGFAMPDVNVEVKAEVTAEELAKSLREAMKPAMRMAVE